jgi:hypothetical protein
VAKIFGVKCGAFVLKCRGDNQTVPEGKAPGSSDMERKLIIGIFKGYDISKLYKTVFNFVSDQLFRNFVFAGKDPDIVRLLSPSGTP